MSGNCYAILFSNGVCKVGRSGDISGRVASHVRNGESMGLAIELIVISQSVADEKKLEEDLLSKFKWESKTRGVEYFEGIDKSMVISAFVDLGIVFYPIKDIRKVSADGIVCTIPNEYVNCKEDSDHMDKLEIIDIKTKIVGYLKRSSQPTGIIINKLRSRSRLMILKALSELQEQGIIDCEKHIHPKKQFEVKTWHLIDK